MSAGKGESAESIARKIVRQKGRLAELARQLTADPSAGASALAHHSVKVALIDGRIDGLTEALEVVLGVDMVTYDVIERLVSDG